MSQTTDRRPVTRLDPATRRTQIVESAASLFDRRDPLEVRFEEIADAAGVSRALVYNYFGDRDGLLAAVYVHLFEAVQRFIATTVDHDAPTDERVRATVRAYLTFASEHPGAWRLLHVVRAREHETVANAREKLMKGLVRQWGGTVAARAALTAVVGALESATIDWLRNPTAMSLDDLTDLLQDLLWQGMASLEPHGVSAEGAVTVHR